jgi:hypothetical protein
MNDKLENLLYESGLTAQGSLDDMDEFDRQAIDRLVDLIVNECALVGRRHILERHGMSLDYTGRVLVEDAIRNHFKEQQ